LRTSVDLIRSLGGGWSRDEIDKVEPVALASKK
jgi:hypothetical protein